MVLAFCRRCSGHPLCLSILVGRSGVIGTTQIHRSDWDAISIVGFWNWSIDTGSIEKMAVVVFRNKVDSTVLGLKLSLFHYWLGLAEMLEDHFPASFHRMLLLGYLRLFMVLHLKDVFWLILLSALPLELI
uniref:Succinate dehydrogenase subunit 4 n=1 Tax=Viscum scurruloideum TaxID=1664545 RepID=A0A0H3WGU1_9MAGN|nr:succinate dehydrogenase subunit 4 [Viscum scurruloideum]